MKLLFIAILVLGTFSAFAQSEDKTPLVVSCAVELEITTVEKYGTERQVYADVVAVGETYQVALGKVKNNICIDLMGTTNCEGYNNATIKTATVTTAISNSTAHNRKTISDLVKVNAVCETQTGI